MEEDLGCDREQPLSTPKNLLPSGARGFRRKAADSLCAPLGQTFAWARWPHARSPAGPQGVMWIWPASLVVKMLAPVPVSVVKRSPGTLMGMPVQVITVVTGAKRSISRPPTSTATGTQPPHQQRDICIVCPLKEAQRPLWDQ